MRLLSLSKYCFSLFHNLLFSLVYSSNQQQNDSSSTITTLLPYWVAPRTMFIVTTYLTYRYFTFLTLFFLQSLLSLPILLLLKCLFWHTRFLLLTDNSSLITDSVSFLLIFDNKTDWQNWIFFSNCFCWIYLFWIPRKFECTLTVYQWTWTDDVLLILLNPCTYLKCMKQFRQFCFHWKNLNYEITKFHLGILHDLNAYKIEVTVCSPISSLMWMQIYFASAPIKLNSLVPR